MSSILTGAHTFDRNRFSQTSLAWVVRLVRVLAPPTSPAEAPGISRNQREPHVAYVQVKPHFRKSRTGSIPGSSTRRVADQDRVEVSDLSAAVPGAGVPALHPKLAVPLRR
jgi:hypothetical protein